jgi:ribosomal protein L34
MWGRGRSSFNNSQTKRAAQAGFRARPFTDCDSYALKRPKVAKYHAKATMN